MVEPWARGYGGGEKMIYLGWSLLSSTATIWGGAAAAGLAGVFLFGGKLLSSRGKMLGAM
ncbi:hypothetical protein GQ55_2G334600 [Panicum hallii var. hallii]|uniref:Uncharacterized protein n=1 Tax=Panicum hallii var. hallii TaxID=1504633 RepID=A0A2T7EV43_9POAL|nr:hypothetical protein GQ55_2G334600 [Panicum hallii var. hallii]